MVSSNGIPQRIIAAATTNATIIKVGESAIGGFGVSSKAAYSIFIKFYDKATAPTKDDTPVFVWEQKETSSDWLNGVDMHFLRGVGIRIVKGQADNDDTATVAGDCVLSFTYA